MRSTKSTHPFAKSAKRMGHTQRDLGQPGGNAWILRWESFARRRTPLPQDDNGEREDIGRVRAPALRGLEKVPPFRKGREKDGAHAGPQRLKPVSLVCLNRSAEALRHPNSAAPTHQSKTGIDGDPGCSATQVHSAAATPFAKRREKDAPAGCLGFACAGMHGSFVGSPSRGEGLRCLRMTMGKGRVLGR